MWRWLSCALTGSSGTVQWVSSPGTVQMSSPAGTSTHPWALSPLPWSPHRTGGLHTPRQAATLEQGLAAGGFGAEWHTIKLHQQRQPGSLLALENALQHPNPAVLQARADGPANCQYATASAPCVVLQRAIVMAASNEENWCVFVLLPFK